MFRWLPSFRLRRLWPLLLLAAVSAGASAGIGHFRAGTDRARAAEYTLLAVRADVFAAEAGAGRDAAGDGTGSRRFLAELGVATAELRQLERSDPATAASVGSLLRGIEVYRREALRRWAAARRGQVELAARTGRRGVVPALTSLERTSESAVRASDRRRAESEARAVLGVRAIVFSVALVMLLALSLYGRARRSAERSQLEQELLRKQVAMRGYEAEHDDLTGLLNRRGFFSVLRRELGTPEAQAPAVLLLDLDGFKEVNDTLGHGAGDALLVEIGARLRKVVGEGDVLARVGGDEFAIVASGGEALEHAQQIARRIDPAFGLPFEIAGLALRIRASVGIADGRGQPLSADELLRRADVAMYQAKATQENVAVYATAEDPRSNERLRLVSELERALDGDELVVHYQPQAHLGDGAISGVEALVRWQHPQRGLLSPAAFIPATERSGLIRRLTLEVLGRALRQQAAWRAEGLDLPVAVNLSIANLLDDDLPEDVDALLREHGTRPEQLRLEITESYLVTDATRVHRNLMQICRRGIHLALDDFGTGYSSLTHLRQLPIEELKIDRSFIRGLGRDSQDAAIVRAMVDLAHSLELSVVAEGVETRAVWNQLRDLGCDRAQGYHLASPLPAARLTGWLVDYMRAPVYALRAG
jgi:diguanylate cyclase (GGDEF)-like protein